LSESNGAKSNITAIALEPAEAGQIVQIKFHTHPVPGKPCDFCARTFPKVRADAPHGSARDILQVSVPKGHEGVIDQMLIELVDKYQQQWPREYAAMRNEVGLEVVGGRSWKYHALHFATYAALTVPGLEPVEEG
jgi:hypothetical protein